MDDAFSWWSDARQSGAVLRRELAIALGQDVSNNSNNPRTVPKTAVLVEISLTDGETFYGNIFVNHQSRLSDVLNDDRKFLPVQTSDGSFLGIAKTAIKQVRLPAAEAAVYRGADPYKVLGVEQGISLEDLKRTYHQLCMANHPDRIKGFGLGSEYQDLGTRNTVRINDAYAQLLKTFRTPSTDAA